MASDDIDKTWTCCAGFMNLLRYLPTAAEPKLHVMNAITCRFSFLSCIIAMKSD
jgi:hypothetical protein